LFVRDAVELSQVELDGDRVYWVESRPAEGGRQVVVRAESDGTMTELLPGGFSARSQVHEYGGRCYTVVDGVLVASNWEDQRLWRFADAHEPVSLTPDPPTPRADRYADPVATPDGQWIICVRERHILSSGDQAERVDNDLVAVALDAGDKAAEPVVLTGGHDFYAAPRLSPDGTELAWLCWDHPNMPWDDTELWRAPLTAGSAGPSLGSATFVAGGHESIAQPRWSPGGVLHYVSDRSGWWNVYAGDRALFPIEAECTEPGWEFGTSTYGFATEGDLLVTWSGPGGTGLDRVVDGVAYPIDAGFGAYTSLQIAGRSVVCVAGSMTDAPAVVRIDMDNGRVEVLRRSRELSVDPSFLSRPERVRFPTSDCEEAWALVYPPTSADYEGLEGTLPPLIVMAHGGPTAAASGVLNLGVQYWTSRGFAVADVDYRGSTGYGRAYRERLRGQWGVLDVEDCAGVARWLANQGRTDRSRSVIRGGSAGGFTTLAALVFTDVFVAGAFHFGIADLELFARDTHKFESRYLDRLVGPWPEAAELYRVRSPIHHLESFICPVIVFQGLEDKICLPAQAELLYRALHDRRTPVAYLTFEGEQHTFRRAETIVRVAEAELAFYGRVLGFSPHGAVDVPIDNADRLGLRAQGSVPTE
jgi:dipeptidyl aminopeptidase/acylaminoacyl peptidase